MRYALIIAGGSGTRLWPMSRARLPKQLIPLIDGKSLLRVAVDHLDGLIPPEKRYICAGLSHRDVILGEIPEMPPGHFLGEPTGRDTLNAVGLGAAVLAKTDPDAVVAVLTADHIIKPSEGFRRVLEHGFNLVESSPETLVTFGIKPTHPATGYGYLQLGDAVDQDGARSVVEYKEKPKLQVAQRYLAAGPDEYRWNSGLFIWRAATLLGCIERFAPANHAGLMEIAEAWDTDRRDAVLAAIYPTLEKISIDYAVMEKAPKDDRVNVAAVPMDLTWLDIGSWPAFAETRTADEQGNAISADCHALVDTRGCTVVSTDSSHLVATIGCEDLIIVHTDDATLICRADRAESIKQLYSLIEQEHGEAYL